MTSTRSRKNEPTGAYKPPTDTVPSDFPSEFGGEFQQLGAQLTANLGTLIALCCNGGGYFGVSVTDDGGSVRLVARHKELQFDKRFYSLPKLEGATAWLAGRLRAME